MISVWNVMTVYDKLTRTQWRVVNEEYGRIGVSEYGMQLVARDRTVLSAGFASREQVHVWITDADGRARLRILVDRDLAAVTEFHFGLGSAVDFCEALLYAHSNVVWDDVEGYLWDRAAVGGRELVISFGGEEDDAIRD